MLNLNNLNFINYYKFKSIHMITPGLTSCSLTGKFISHRIDLFGLRELFTINLSSKFPNNFISCKFDDTDFKILINDKEGNMIRVNLHQKSNCNLVKAKIQQFCYYNEKPMQIFAVYSEKQSRLVSINPINKKQQTFCNLAMNKILSLKINMLRNVILAMDCHLLMLIDIKSKREFRSIKSRNCKFVDATFSSDNKSIILLTDRLELKILKIANLQEQFSIKIPLQFTQAKLECSFNSKFIAVIGNFHGMYLLEFEDVSQQYLLTRIEIDVKIKQIKYLLDGSMILLGYDQIFYLFSPTDGADKITELFNFQLQTPMHNFDVSLNNENLVSLSNYGNIYVYKLKETLKLIKNKGKKLKTREVFWVNDCPTKEIDPDELNKSFEVENKEELYQQQKQNVQQIQKQQQQLPIINQQPEYNYFQHIPVKRYIVQDDKDNKSQQSMQLYEQIDKKQIISEQFYRLKKLTNEDYLFKDYKASIIKLIIGLNQVFVAHKAECLAIFFLDWINNIKNSIHDFSFIMIPHIIAVIQKQFEIQYDDFSGSTICSLFVKYFSTEDWLKILQFLIENKNKQAVLVLVFINLLKTFENQIIGFKSSSEFFGLLESCPKINLETFTKEVLVLYENSPNRILFEPLNKLKEYPNRKFEQEFSAKKYLLGNIQNSTKDSKQTNDFEYGRLKELYKKQQAYNRVLQTISEKKNNLIKND